MHVRAASVPRFLRLPPEQIGKEIARGKIRVSAPVFIGTVVGCLGGKILVKSLARMLGSRSVDLSAVKAFPLVPIRRQLIGARNLFECAEVYARLRGSKPSSTILCTTSSSTIAAGGVCSRRAISCTPSQTSFASGTAFPPTSSFLRAAFLSFQHEFDDFALGYLPGLSARLLSLELEFGLQCQESRP